MHNDSSLLVLFLSSALTAFSASGSDRARSEQPVSEQTQESPAPVKETIVVTASRSEQSAETVPVTVTVMTTEELETTPAVAIDDVIRGIPGVNLPALAATEQYHTNNVVSLRGVGGNRTLVMVDGLPINNPFRSFVEWSRVPVESLERVEIVRGGSSSLFGNYALSGAIHLITRPVDASRLELRALYGMYDTRRAHLSLSDVPDPKLRWMLDLGGHHSDSGGFASLERRSPIGPGAVSYTLPA
ncbi:MAG TPA: TonB-dependent receptor plug domain-containing protein [Thermoanaerobaculia bacterium]|nr:TonB-dependent receptor plug domain-containing protein [Thermoanaerobaculia bacterium]